MAKTTSASGMKVVFFHRKPRPAFNFSVENLFKEIRKALPPSVDWEVKEAKFYSEGFFRRLYISFEAALNQQEVNHVTGDINFIAIFLSKPKTVMTILDLGFMNHPNKVYRKILQWFWVIFPSHRAGIITTISQATKNELLKFVKVDPEKVKVIYVPISSLFRASEKKFNAAKPRILQIGTGPNKNVIRMIRSLAGIPCEVDLVGSINDELKAELERSGISYTASKNLSNEEIVDKYKTADIVSFVSTYEGFGMPIVEANAIGRAVITSNILSMPEVGGNAAHYVDPYDVADIRKGFEKLIGDESYRNQLIANGFENRKRFDVNEIARQYTEIYDMLAK